MLNVFVWRSAGIGALDVLMMFAESFSFWARREYDENIPLQVSFLRVDHGFLGLSHGFCLLILPVASGLFKLHCFGRGPGSSKRQAARVRKGKRQSRFCDMAWSGRFEGDLMVQLLAMAAFRKHVSGLFLASAVFEAFCMRQ